MAKLRFVQIEIEDFASDDIRVLASIMGGQAAGAIAAPVIVQPALLAPPNGNSHEVQSAPLANGNGHEVRHGRPPKLSTETAAKQTNSKQTKVKETPGRAPAEGGTRDLILQQLKKKPMSSLELIQALKREDVPHQVYQACSALKAAGVVNSEIDETDGTRRWSLAA